MPDVIRAMGGEMTLFDGLTLPAEDVVARVRERFEQLHDLPQELREDAYRDLLVSDEYLRLKERMDLWCALWFWPPDDESLPTPRTWADLDADAAKTLEGIVAEQRFFHWEVEFSDVFSKDRQGFDAVLGNPPWETVQIEPAEFFSRVDPLYRSYGKTEATAVERRLFTELDGLENRWMNYESSFRALVNWVRSVAVPFEVPLGRGRASEALRDAWSRIRSSRPNLAERDHPFRYQGSGKLFTYKAFLEVALHLGGGSGRVGFVVPSGLYTDRGSTMLRQTLISECSWEWAYFFENARQLFPIHRSYKFGPIIVDRGGKTESIGAAFMRQDVREWEHPLDNAVQLSEVAIRRFAPSTWSFMEFKNSRDFEVIGHIYGDHELLGDYVERQGARFNLEFMMNTHDRLFRRRSWLEAQGLLSPRDDSRDPRVRARLRIAGFVPLYEGKSFGLHNPYFKGPNSSDSVNKFVGLAEIERELTSRSWEGVRLVFRDIARSTDQRTMITALIPPAVHGNTGPSIEGDIKPELLAARLGSMVLDYVIRMKISAHLNWHYMETLPIADCGSDGAVAEEMIQLVRALNAIGSDFGHAADQDPLVEPQSRMAARLVLDALVADRHGLDPDELRHIAATFQNYDRGAPQPLRYPSLVIEVYEAMVLSGVSGAKDLAAELVAHRETTGCGFGLDELWQPQDGWDHANHEARGILGEAGLR